MKVFKDKPCRHCGTVFTPSSPCNLYCSKSCAKIVADEKHKVASWKKHVKTMTEKGKAHLIGVGKGGGAKKWKEDSQYKNGIGQFNRLRKKMKEEINRCQRCNKDLSDVPHAGWACHHKDHDRTNNVPENLELLCKRCHQIEHKCWKSFEGATTIPKGSTPKQAEAPDTQDG
jgi:hypothetical protein